MTHLDPLWIGLAGALATQTLTLWWHRGAILRARKQAAEEKFSSALRSDDLTTLATYLHGDLGEISVGEYLADVEVRNDVDKFLARLAAFVAPPATDDATDAPRPVQMAEPIAARASNASTPLAPLDDDPPQIVAALATLRDGDIWSALARLRRELEATLRELRGRGPEHLLGLGPAHQSGRFSATTDVPAEAVPRFRHFWRIASAAVHGQSVSMEEAIEAVANARAVYAAIDRVLALLERDPPTGGPKQ